MNPDKYREYCNSAKSSRHLFEGLTDIFRTTGFDRCIFSLGVNFPELCIPATHGYYSTYSPEWNAYHGQRYWRSDAVRLRIPQIYKPFTWQSLLDGGRLLRIQEACFRDAWEAGLRDGVAFPLHGGAAGIAAASSLGGPDLRPATLDILHDCAELFFKSFYRLELKCDYLDLPTPVTSREREIVSLAMQGMSEKEIAAVLGISPRTVNNQTRILRWKQDTANMTETASKLQFQKQVSASAGELVPLRDMKRR